MTRVGCRSCRVLDGMILVAAIAAGFALARLRRPQSDGISLHSVREWGSATFGAIMLLKCTTGQGFRRV
jgi:hypothetical protein